MGRKRSPENQNLPRGMIYNKKADTYYLRAVGQKDIRLGKTVHEAFRNYYAYAEINYECRTMFDLIDRYMKEVSPTKAKNTHKSNIAAAKNLIKRFGSMNPTMVRARHAYQYLDLRAREGAPVRANREFALLSTVMTHAVKWGILDSTPFNRIVRNPEKPRDRLVSDEELDVFFKYCPRWLQLYIELKLATGLRQADMVNLSSRDWCEKEGLKVHTSKNKVRIQYNYCDYLAKIVAELKELNGYRLVAKKRVPILHWYFFAASANSKREKPLTDSGLRTAWSRAMRKALASGELKLEQRFQERDLRAKAASDCDSLAQASELLGHSNLTTTKRVYRRGYTKVEALKPDAEKGIDIKQRIEKEP